VASGEVEAVATSSIADGAGKGGVGDDAEGGAVLLRLRAPGARTRDEAIEIVLRDHSAGEASAIPEQMWKSLDQIVLRLTREDWLLLYESISAEAHLRARTVAHHCRALWLSRRPLSAARRLVDLEAEMLQLPIFGQLGGCASGAGSASDEASAVAASADGAVAATEEERHLRMFLQAWEDHEAWVAAVEEHLGPLDLEISRERTNNLQRGRAHTPYAADLLRLAFRNFAICEGRLFFALALGVYGLIARLLAGRASAETLELLEALHRMAKAYGVQDDALATQRGTLQEYRYYLLEPLRRTCQRFSAGLDADEEDDDGGVAHAFGPTCPSGVAPRGSGGAVSRSSGGASSMGGARGRCAWSSAASWGLCG